MSLFVWGVQHEAKEPMNLRTYEPFTLALSLQMMLIITGISSEP